MLPPPVDACSLDPKFSPDQLLLEDCILSALKVDWAALHPQSQAAFRLVALSRGLWKGQLLDSCWSVLDPKRARNTHIFSICTGTDGAITLRLNLVHSGCGGKGELVITQANVEAQAKRHFSAAALTADVVVVLVSRTPEGDRHSKGMLLGKGHSLQGLYDKVMHGDHQIGQDEDHCL